ncbi:AAA family ATPase [Candidatus Woesearchaeota archaeon]|nr:AAA family ATPase [Candidatus Woesearchaeota archaeon]
MKGKTIGVISIKGGVGKTTLVSNLGAALANKFKKKVLLVDGNVTAPNLGLHLGVVDAKHSLHDVLYDNTNISQAIQKTEHGFDLLTSSLAPTKEQKKSINPYKLHNRLSQVKELYDFIVIDSSPNLNDEMLSTMIASDELLVVTGPDYPTLSCTMQAVKTAKEKKTPIAGLVLNKVRNKKFELSVNDIENATGVPVLSVIRDNVKVLEALSSTKPAVLYSARNKASLAYIELAGKITGEKPPIRKSLSRVKKVFGIS